jgi:short-subunit dehydrogenase
VDAFDGKVALVVGGSTGIGLEAARRLAARGARVVLAARREAELERAAHEVGPAASALRFDISDLDAAAALPGRVREAQGRLDCVVNSAGVNHRGPLLSFPARALTDIVHVNLAAAIALTRGAAEVLPRGGAIVHVASLAGRVPVPHEAAYSASKMGLRAFCRAAGIELEEMGITVSVVSPGPVDTGFLGDLADVPDIVLSQPMSTAAQVADAVLECLRTGAAEIAMPRSSAVLTALANLFPGLSRRVRPALERMGARNKARYLARRRAR